MNLLEKTNTSQATRSIVLHALPDIECQNEGHNKSRPSLDCALVFSTAFHPSLLVTSWSFT